MNTQDNRPLVGGIVLAGAGVLGLLAALCWTGVLPGDHGARVTVSFALGIAAFADALVGLFFLMKSRQPQHS